MTNEQIEKLLKADDMEFIMKVSLLIGNNPDKELGDYVKREILKAVNDYDAGDWL